MRQVTRKGLMTVAAATGVIAAASGYAQADSGANGSASHSPGVLSGNTVQAPVHVPVNVCGNTVDVVGILNPAMGNSCTNQSAGESGGESGGGYGDGESNGGSGAQSGSGGAQAGGHTADSPGVASGNHVEAPIHVPVNVCGNSVDVVGALNPTTGNDCANGSGPSGDYGTPPGGEQETPGNQGPGNQGPGKPADSGTSSPSESKGAPSTPDDVTPAGHASAHQPAHSAQLAATGSELPLGLALPVGAGALLAGTVLYRKARASV